MPMTQERLYRWECGDMSGEIVAASAGKARHRIVTAAREAMMPVTYADVRITLFPPTETEEQRDEQLR